MHQNLRGQSIRLPFIITSSSIHSLTDRCFRLKNRSMGEAKWETNDQLLISQRRHIVLISHLCQVGSVSTPLLSISSRQTGRYRWIYFYMESTAINHQSHTILAFTALPSHQVCGNVFLLSKVSPTDGLFLLPLQKMHSDRRTYSITSRKMLTASPGNIGF